jgi:hypothetical protein
MAQLWGHTWRFTYSGATTYAAAPAVGQRASFDWGDGEGAYGVVVAKTGTAASGTIDVRVSYDTYGFLYSPDAGTTNVSTDDGVSTLYWQALSPTFTQLLSDRTNVGLSLSYGSAVNNVFVCGWWRPNPVTNGRVLFSIGGLTVEVFSGTALKLSTTNASTNGSWTATATDATGFFNTWNFIAVLFNGSNSGPTGNWRAWHARAGGWPEEMSVSLTTSPIGVFQTGSNFLYVGNNPTSTLNWRGEIGPMWVVGETRPSTGLMPFGEGNLISASEAASFRDNVVIPFFQGNPPTTSAGSMECVIVANDGTDPVVVSQGLTPTISIATIGGPLAGTQTGNTTFTPPTTGGSTWPSSGSSSQTSQRGL